MVEPTPLEVRKAIWLDVLRDVAGRSPAARARTSVTQCAVCGATALGSIEGRPLCVRHTGQRARLLLEASRG